MAQLSQRFAQFVAARPQPQIILGTQSVSRRAIVDAVAQEFEFKYSCITADIDERAIRRDDPRDLVLTLAHAKAAAIADKLRRSGAYITPGYLVTCDQVVVHEGAIREKPLSDAEARRFIRSYAEAPAVTIGACVCTCLETGQVAEDVDRNEVHFDTIPEDIIEQLVDDGGVYECAGGLMVEHPLVQDYVKRVEGTLDGVMGLSKESFMRVLVHTVDNGARTTSNSG